MRRRTFLKEFGAGAMLLGSGSLLTACGRDDSGVSQQIGVQLFTLRNQLQVDVGKTLADVAAIGYQEVEPFGLGGNAFVNDPFFGHTAQEFRSFLSDAGLGAPLAHISGDAMNIAEIADLAQEIGAHHLVVGMAPDFLTYGNGEIRVTGVTGRDQVDRIAERLNRQGEMARASGIGFAYHNHHMEFVSIGDESAFDYLFAQVDADLVKIELDIGWTLAAGADPIALLQHYAGRVISVHLKDYDPGLPPGDDATIYPIPEQAQLTEPGSGPTDFKPVMAALDATGVDHRFVEIDVAPEPVAAVARGYDYLTVL